MSALGFYEFFAGGGMARAGLGPGWRCLFANDLDPMKARVYQENFGGSDFVRRDVALLAAKDLPGVADLAWASFPCQDLSLAGDQRGLGAEGAEKASRSGTFWPFWSLIRDLGREGRAPALVVLENVLGVLTSSGGEDFRRLCQALCEGGYRYGAMVLDARRFLPQSRPRVFIIAVRRDLAIRQALVAEEPEPLWSPGALLAARARLPEPLASQWVWWRLPGPAGSPPPFAALLDPSPGFWHEEEETQRLLAMMSPANRRKVEAAQAEGRLRVGTLYRRTRPQGDGGRQVRAEVRFDDVAGCLRTPAGGSSRQTLLIVEGDRVRSRLMSGREAARLMGLADGYKLPMRSSQAYHVAGDGVAVPVVRHLARHLLEPLALGARAPLGTRAKANRVPQRRGDALVV